jgi:hypothetical protein
VIVHEELASVGQRMLWLMDHYRGGDGRLNYPLLLRIRGPLRLPRLQRALDLVVERHETLRTTFARRRGLLTQLVRAPEPVAVRTVPLPPGAEEELRQRVRQEVETPIDPTVSPVRVTLWSLGAEDHLLCLNAHHLVTDAWSSRLLTDELVHMLGEQGSPLPRVPWQYRHFTQWQRRQSTAERLRADREYWLRRLEGVAALGLARAAGSPGLPPGGSRTVRLDLDPAVARRVREIARIERATPFTVLLALYYLALHRETGRRDICVTAPFASRSRPETAQTVGLFANMVILRTRLGPDLALADLIERTKLTVTEALAHQEFPYYLLPLDDSGTRLDRFDDVVFQMLPELPPPSALGDLTVEVVPPEITSRFDLELVVLPHRDGFRARVQYASDRIADDVALRLASRYQTAVSRAVSATAS